MSSLQTVRKEVLSFRIVELQQVADRLGLRKNGEHVRQCVEQAL